MHAPTLTPTPTRTATPTASPTSTRSPTPTPTLPLLVADANCDGHGTAADFCAAIIVSGNAAKFPGCPYADSFRDRGLSDRDFIPILADIFDTFAAPWTPTPSPSSTITRTPNGTRTRTPTVPRTPTPTAPPTSTATASTTATVTPSATPTPTATATRVPTRTPTQTFTHAPTATRTATSTPTPTGIAHQLSGDWAANWGGQICYLNGQVFARLPDTIYHVTSVAGQLDIQTLDGATIGRGLTLDTTGTVKTTYRFFDQRVCLINGVFQEFVFDYTFTFHTNGTGTATAHWTYAFNTNCATCEVTDSATLVRVARPL